MKIKEDNAGRALTAGYHQDSYGDSCDYDRSMVTLSDFLNASYDFHKPT